MLGPAESLTVDVGFYLDRAEKIDPKIKYVGRGVDDDKRNVFEPIKIFSALCLKWSSNFVKKHKGRVFKSLRRKYSEKTKEKKKRRRLTLPMVW